MPLITPVPVRQHSGLRLNGAQLLERILVERCVLTAGPPRRRPGPCPCMAWRQACLEGRVRVVLHGARHAERRLERVRGAVIHDRKLAVRRHQLQQALRLEALQRHALREHP